MDLLHIDGTRTRGNSEFVASPVECSPLVVGRSQSSGRLLQQRVVCEVGGITTGRDNDGAKCSGNFAVMNVFDTSDGARLVIDEFGYTSLLKDLNAVGNRLGEVLETLELSGT